MRSRLSTICGTIILSIILVLSISGCKEFGIPDHTLIVVIENGVTGTPTSGEYTHKELDKIEYNYIPENSEHTVEVLVNGGRWTSSGELTMYADINMEVRIFDIRDTWTFRMNPPSDSDDDTIEFTVTFSGDDFLTGSFTDSRGYKGLWTISETDLTMNYSNWQNYIFKGTIPTMTGTWTWWSIM